MGSRSELRVFHGWKILATMLCTQAFTSGMFVYGFGVLQIPIAEEFGVSRSAVSLTVSAAMLLGAVAAPWIGRILDRGPIRRIMLVCAVLTTLAYVAMSLASSLVAVLALYTIASAVGLQGMGNVPASKLMGSWFRRQRGRALGLAALGTSIGGLLAPPLLSEGVARFGWRVTVGGAAAVALGVLVGPIAIVIRDHPRDLGLHPDGATSSPPDWPATSGESSWPATRLLREPGFLSLAIVLGVLMATNGALIAHLPPIAMELGLAATPAAALVSVLSIAAIVGKLLFGFAADHVDHRLLLATAIVLLATFVGLLAAQPSAQWLVAAAVLPGLSLGGVLPLWGAILSDYYGSDSMAGAMGLMMPMMVTVQIAAMQLVPWAYDQTGSYQLAFRWMLGAFFFVALAMMTLRRPAVSRPPPEPRVP